MASATINLTGTLADTAAPEVDNFVKWFRDGMPCGQHRENNAYGVCQRGWVDC